MNNAQIPDTLLDQGNLTGFINELMAKVKDNPENKALRTALFEGLCFAGDFERAGKHLQVLISMPNERPDILKMYQNLLKAEVIRRDVLSKGTKPEFSNENSEILQTTYQALSAFVKKDTATYDAAMQKLKAFPLINSAVYQEQDSQIVRDMDDLFLQTLEVIYHDGRYAWIDLNQIEIILPDQVKDWIDTLWMPVSILLKDGTISKVFLPAIYYFPQGTATELMKLGKVTEWVDTGNQHYRGLGLKILLIGNEEVPVLELKKLSLFSTTPPA